MDFYTFVARIVFDVVLHTKTSKRCRKLGKFPRR